MSTQQKLDLTTEPEVPPCWKIQPVYKGQEISTRAPTTEQEEDPPPEVDLSADGEGTELYPPVIL